MRKLTLWQKEEMRRNLMDVMERDLPPLMRIPIPDRIKAEPWFKESGAENILKKYAFLGAEIRAHNGKTPSAFMSWLIDENAGKFNKDVLVIGGTSGNWGMASGLIAPMFDVEGFAAVIEKSVPAGKQNHLLASGAEIIFAPDGVSPIDYMYELAEKFPERYHLINQYVHRGSVIGHKWSMDHIAREFERFDMVPTMFGAVTGTCSTIVAADRYLRGLNFPKMKIFGVASMSKKEKVPGSRSPESLYELKKLPGSFRNMVDDVMNFPLVTSVPRAEVYRLNADFYQQYYRSFGPTSVLLEAGSYHLLRDYWMEHGNFDGLDLVNEDGYIVMVSFFMDMHLPYLDDPEFLTAFRS
jgi:cysteine synthase